MRYLRNVVLVFLITFSGVFTSASMKDSKQEIWVMFDLGETIVTSNPSSNNSHDPNAKFHYLAGAQDYIEKLHEKGYKTGLIVNIPERWGTTFELKMEMLKKFISDNWDDTVAFDWSPFEDLVIIPMFDKERKPAPDLFLKTKDLAQSRGAKFLYQGEDEAEIKSAKSLGIPVYQVGLESGFYLDSAKIEDYINSN